MKVRMTLVLDDFVARKLRADADNMSELVNGLLRKELFGERKSMFGALRGKISGKDKVEDDD